MIVATSMESSDTPLVELCQQMGIEFSRGALDDVLDRFYHAAQPIAPKHVIRLTGDCPLADPEVIDHCIDYHLRGNFDYTTNALQPTFPDGLDVEVIRFESIVDAWHEAKLASEREHVTPFIYNRPERYHIGHYKQSNDLSWLRWTVDEPADFQVVDAIYRALYPTNRAFTTSDILAYLATHPEIARLNIDTTRNEGYLKSLAAEQPNL